MIQQACNCAIFIRKVCKFYALLKNDICQSRIYQVRGVPTWAQGLKCAHCHPPWLSRVVGDICRISCSIIDRSMCTLYWNKNINTFWINGAFITKLNVAFLLGHPISAFLKLWSADHKWSSGSALVVLLDWTLVQRRQKRIKLTWIAYHTL